MHPILYIPIPTDKLRNTSLPQWLPFSCASATFSINRVGMAGTHTHMLELNSARACSGAQQLSSAQLLPLTSLCLQDFPYSHTAHPTGTGEGGEGDIIHVHVQPGKTDASLG